MIALSTPEDNIQMNQWSHVVAIVHFDENRFQIFVNGKEIKTTWNKEVKFKSPKTPNTSPINIIIGSEDDGKNNFYEGNLFCQNSKTLTLCSLKSAPLNFSKIN
jgi:hypothetical protein